MAAALSVFSCKVEDGYYYRQLDSDRLEKYAEGIYLSYVCGELDMMMRLLDIDHFISLSPEEQRESPLAGKVFHVDGNTLVIEQVFSEARISTGGKRLLETGAGWTVENFCSDMGCSYLQTGGKRLLETGAGWTVENFCSDMGCSYLQSSLLYAEVACKEEGVWEILMRTADSSECVMEITVTSDDVGRTGKFTVSGHETSSDGYRSVFSNTGDAFSYSNSIISGSSDIAGTLSIDIYSGDLLKDWCMITCDESGRVWYRTSR